MDTIAADNGSVGRNPGSCGSCVMRLRVYCTPVPSATASEEGTGWWLYDIQTVEVYEVEEID